MEVYDSANKLAEEIRNSPQYIKYKNSKEELFKDSIKKEKIKEFEKLKQEVQLIEMKGLRNEEIDSQEKKSKLSKLYCILVENKDIKEYFDNEIAFNQMIIDINKIIGEAIKEVVDTY